MNLYKTNIHGGILDQHFASSSYERSDLELLYTIFNEDFISECEIKSSVFKNCIL